MGRTVVELDDVGKLYRLGEHHGGGGDLRDRLASVGARIRGRAKPQVQELWSLRDVSLEVHEGQALGIIGANGAGKSTLLKIIGSITTPTIGRSRTRGRVGSLLEVGTGFHRELTGLENTYLNGAILGMRRSEVTTRLDEIIEFSGLQRFMDTPVKRYSSGMYLRLGFAIAAHLAADILLVDEVLAVGDAEFQRRCLGKMSEVEQSGRTVLFVSHNLDAMVKLCPTSIWLEAGRVRAAGNTASLVQDYLRTTGGADRASVVELPTDSSQRAQVAAVALTDAEGHAQNLLSTRDSSWIQVDLIVRDVIPGLEVCAFVSTTRGTNILAEATNDVGDTDISKPGRYRLRCRLPPVLTPGTFTIDTWLGTAYEDFETRVRVLSFSVEGADRGRPHRLVKLGLPWEVELLP